MTFLSSFADLALSKCPLSLVEIQKNHLLFLPNYYFIQFQSWVQYLVMVDIEISNRVHSQILGVPLH